MTESQRRLLENWAFRVARLSEYRVADIEEIKYDGRLVILDDGSRWEVVSYDASTADLWNTLDKVVIIDGDMYNIEDCEHVGVKEES